jgi:hypothetical protein
MEAQQAQQTPGIGGIDSGQHRDRSFAVGLDQIGHGEGELAPQGTGRVVDGEVLRRNAGSLQPDRQQGIADGHSGGGGNDGHITVQGVAGMEKDGREAERGKGGGDPARHDAACAHPTHYQLHQRAAELVSKGSAAFTWPGSSR